MIWLHFIGSAALVIGGGYYLARQGKELGDRYGLSDLWIGFIFLSAVTSIPELATALGAVTVAASPSLALTDVLGSNAFNLFAAAVLGLALFPSLTLGSFRVPILMILLMTGLVLGFAVFDRAGNLVSPGGISYASWAILALYLLGSWKLFRDEHPAPLTAAPPLPPEKAGPGADSFYVRLIVSVGLVVAGGFWLAWAGSRIAGETGWGDGFVGALFLALVTSLPELSVCLGAMKIAAPEMALSNILGSNVFNLGIIFWADLAYGRSSILAGVDGPTLVSGGLGAFFALLLACALKMKRPASVPAVMAINLAIVLAYLIGLRWIFSLSAGGIG